MSTTRSALAMSLLAVSIAAACYDPLDWEPFPSADAGTDTDTDSDGDTDTDTDGDTDTDTDGDTDTDTDAAASISIASTELYSDTNDDGVLSPGETGGVRIFIQNTGSSDALSVWAALESYDTNVTVGSCTSWDGYGCGGDCSCDDAWGLWDYDVEEGEVETTDFVMSITFTLSGDAPLAPIQFELSFHDSLDNMWTDTFEIPVAP